ncbi:MAG: DUF2255 family protein, partial [bacterium]
YAAPMQTFEPATLDLLRRTDEVRIETSGGPGRRVHRTIIWVAVDDADRVLVRSVRGSRGRWYQRMLGNRFGAVLVDGRRIEVHAEPARDAERVSACSAALEAKYPSAGATLRAMLRAEVLDTTLELHPT